MPGLLNKIIINEGTDRGGSEAIRREYKNAVFLGNEIDALEEQDRKEAHRLFTPEWEKECVKFGAEQDSHLKWLREMNNKMRKFADDKLALNQP